MGKGAERRDVIRTGRLAKFFLGAVLTVGFLSPFPSVEWGWIAITALLFWSVEDAREALWRPCLWAWLGLALISSSWPDQPRGWEASLVLLGDVWLGLAVARRLSSLSLANVVLASVLLTLIGHLTIILARPEMGLSPNGAWRGLLPHENGLGRTSGLALVLALLIPGPLWRRALGTATAAVLLWHSTALTPLLAALATLAVWGWNRAPAKTGPRRAVLGLGAALLLAMLVFWEPFLAQLGRTPALSGRLKIWSGSLRFVAEQPLWGHGYVNLEPGWFPGIYHAHNGVLSLVVQLGLVGAAFFLMDLGLCVWGAAGAWKEQEIEIPILLLLYLAVLNLVEVAPPAVGHFAETILYAAATQKLMRRGLGAPPVDEGGDHAQFRKLDPAPQHQA